MVRWFRAALPLVGVLLVAASAPAKELARVGTLTEAVGELERGVKVPVLSQTADRARLLLSTGSQVVIPRQSVQIGESVTLTSALQKMDYFERLAIQNPHADEYYDAQAAPWVALVARELEPRAVVSPARPDQVGESGDLPPRLNVRNSTDYTIRLMLVGPRTISRTIRPGREMDAELKAGEFRVVAHTPVTGVRPFKASWTLRQGFDHQMTLISKTD